LLDFADMVDLIIWRGKSTCFSAFITKIILPHGNSEVEAAVIALCFTPYGKKIKESADI